LWVATTSRLSLGGGLRWPLAGGREEEGVHRARTRSSSSLPRHRQAWILLLLDLVVAARECAMGLRVERPQRNHGESMSSPFPFTEHWLGRGDTGGWITGAFPCSSFLEYHRKDGHIAMLCKRSTH
jgi:hypothetical protein